MNVGIGRQTLTRLVVLGVLAASLAGIAATPAPVQAAEDNTCPLTDGIVINADGTDWGTDFIRSDRQKRDAMQGPVPVDIPAGRYSITLATYDDHINQNDTQPNERWFIEGWKDNVLVFTSNPTADLPSNHNVLVETVNADLDITALDTIVVRHAGYPDTSSPNSMFAVCASFGPSLTQPPGGDPAQIVVLGGASVISPGVLTTLNSCTTGSVTRIAGVDRYATAAAISRAFFDPGVDIAYIATGENFPDALAGSAAAGVGTGGPVLLVRSDSIPVDVRAELTRLAPKKIVILGGTAAVSAKAENLLKAFGPVSRVAGNDRFATAAQTSANAFGTADTVYIATGRNFPDALSGGPAAIQDAGPVLLVEQDSIPGTVKTELSRLNPSQIQVLGGTAAVSDAVVSQLGTYASAVDRISGPNRYATAAEVSRATFPSSGIIFIATGENFPDALAGGPVAGMLGGPILLVQNDAVPGNTKNEIARLTGETCSL